MANENNSLSSWRQVYRAVEQSAPRHRERTDAAGYLTNKQEHIARLCLTSVLVHRQFVTELKAAITNGNTLQDPELQQLVEDYGALALGYFTQDSAKALRMAIEKVLDEGAVVMVRPVH
jgi:ribose 1,5-bisphosphokinase PhnN